jgi:hypothetical protein
LQCEFILAITMSLYRLLIFLFSAILCFNQLSGCSFKDTIALSKDTITLSKGFNAITKIPQIISGRYEIVEDYISFSGSGVSLTFEAPKSVFSIWIEDMATTETKSNWFNLLVDGKYHSRIQLKPGKKLYVIDVQSNKNKLITFIKATEAGIGEVRIYGIELSGSLKVKSSIDLGYTMNIQFIGNSITCGYGNMVTFPENPPGNPLNFFHSKNENAYEAYAMKTARNLDASSMLVCFSGRGVYRNVDGDTNETLPKIYDRIHIQNETSNHWDHTKQVPDVIVINLGTNDYFLESKNKPLNDSLFVQTYIQFVEKLLVYYPDAKIICANGSMLNDNWPEGKCWSRIQKNIAKVCEYFHAKGHEEIYSFFFTPQQPPYGEDCHPTLTTHTRMAEELTLFIKKTILK